MLSSLLFLYGFLVLIRVLLTWVPNLDYSLTPVEMLCKATDPVLDFARRYIPAAGMIDLSPTIVLIVIFFLARTLGQYGL